MNINALYRMKNNKHSPRYQKVSELNGIVLIINFDYPFLEYGMTKKEFDENYEQIL